MAVTLEQIYLNVKEKFQMKLVAGAYGIKTIIGWVHIVETSELIPFLRQKELVITTGISNMTEAELLEFGKQLCKMEISGLVINVGPYISEIPLVLINYCDKENLPLFTLPWEVHLVDVMHDICRTIVYDEQVEDDIVEMFRDGLFFPDKRKECQAVLSRHGFGSETEYQMMALTIEDVDKAELEKGLSIFQFNLERFVNRINGHYILFAQDKIIFLILADYKNEETKLLISSIEEIHMGRGRYPYLVVGPKTTGLEEVSKYYDKAVILLNLAVSRKQQTTYYEDMEVYKLLLAVDDVSVLISFSDAVIGKLDAYDESHGTDSYGLLKQYFRRNGCIQKIAEENFVHRNTINYQLKKIETILGVDLEDWNDRLKLHLCLLIKEIL